MSDLEAFSFDVTVNGLFRHVRVSFDAKFDICALNELLSHSILRSISPLPRFNIRHDNPMDGFFSMITEWLACFQQLSHAVGCQCFPLWQTRSDS